MAIATPCEALESYQKQVDIDEALLKKDPDNELYRGDLAYGLNRVGDLKFYFGSKADAIADFRRAQQIRSEDVKADPTNLWKRTSLIAIQSKLCKMFAYTRQPEKAKTECTGTLSLMEKTDLEPTNAADRSLFADTYFDLGDAYSILSVNQTSCEMYGKSLQIWQDLKQRGLLSNSNSGKIEFVSSRMSGCSVN